MEMSVILGIAVLLNAALFRLLLVPVLPRQPQSWQRVLGMPAALG
jgi:hypothetical protein